jgi:NADP-dependent aldehyde dehydrogenase
MFQTFNPLLNCANPQYITENTEEDLCKAVDLAHDAFIRLGEISNENRAVFLEQIATNIEELGDVLLDMYCAESGFTLERAQTEQTRTTKQLRDFASVVRKNEWIQASIDTADVNRLPQKPDLRKMRVAIGPVAVFGASNFPLAYSTAGGDTASALAAGCSVVVKAHPFHAGTGNLIAKAILDAAASTGMPNGIFSNLNSSNYSIGEKLVLHPKIKAVGFTGSFKGGKYLMDLANKRETPIPVFAEMGSVNPIIFLPGFSTLEEGKWHDKLVGSMLTGLGQFCTSPGLLFFVDNTESNLFIQQIAATITEMQLGPMLHPDLAKNFADKRNALLQFPNLAVFSASSDPTRVSPQQTILVVNSTDFRVNPELQEEVFGPFAIAIMCKDEADVKNTITELKGQLTGTIIGSVENAQENTALILTLQEKVGRLIFNAVPTGVEVCPSMHHGGPFPASSDARFTAVGEDAILRFSRPVVFQNFPERLLPNALKNHNIEGSLRKINGEMTTASIE